jgi:CRISPR-associated endonuclease/helicase Cas3
MNPAIIEFWGKARPLASGTPRVHPLVAHCLDVAAVAVLLPSRRGTAVDPRMVGFLTSLHDIGKFSRPFQAQAPEHWPAQYLGPLPAKLSLSERHDAVGLHLLAGPLADRLNAVLPPDADEQIGWLASDLVYLWSAVAGHHGRPPKHPEQLREDVVCKLCRSAATEFIDAMLEVFRPPAWTVPKTGVVRLAWHLAGLTTLADWIGSRQEWFPYVEASDIVDPTAYFWGHALPRAASALAAAGLSGCAPAPFGGLRRLFPSVSRLTPVQNWAETAALPEGPVLAIIEDLTGSGKTEAAMTLAHRLLASGRGEGVYLALPTMATANAMFGRLADAYHALFALDGRPSLALAHGRADLDPRFAASVQSERTTPEVSRSQDPADDPAESHCAAWLAQDRRRALLAQVGVGTLDQALLAILPVRHATLRLQGVTGKVLIVDEVHAFDPYMREELATLLRFQAALGGSAILLSATLPYALRKKLVDAFRGGLSARPANLECQAYPLATMVGADHVQEMKCAPREGLPRRVTVKRLVDPGEAVERIIAAALSGAAAVWVRNTVDDAQAAVKALRQRGLDPMLFHARFAMQDRLNIEAKVLRRFGRSGHGAVRGCVLVATQVVEQSLDIDFDLMVTDLAPVDLLIQRAGRLWRHTRHDRVVAGPELLIVSPEPVAEPRADWIVSLLPGTGSVYRDHALLWRTAREMFRRGALVTPDDMRPLIEAVSDRDASGAVPAALARSDDEAYAKELGRIGVAAQNVLNLRRGYLHGTGLWEPDTNTPTRIEDQPHITLRLALLRDGRVVPYADDPDPRRAWALSEVSVARHRIASCPVPTHLQRVVASARAEWGRWERDSPYVELALLIPDGDQYKLDARAESGAIVAARYDARTGLFWVKDGSR